MSDSNHAAAVDRFPDRLAANRANALKSTGPRTPEGKASSSQNARKHGFTAANYAVVHLEDVQELSNLKDDAVAFYQPVNSQEHFAVERIALTQLALLRASRLEAGLFTSFVNEALGRGVGFKDPPRIDLDMRPDVLHLAHPQQAENFVFAEGFEHGSQKSNALSLCLRYSAQVARHYKQAVEDFHRLKSLRPEAAAVDSPPSDQDRVAPASACPVDGTNPAALADPGPQPLPDELDETNPNPPEPQQTKQPAPVDLAPRPPAPPQPPIVPFALTPRRPSNGAE